MNDIRFFYLKIFIFFVVKFVFFSPFSIAITSLGEERANLSAFRTFVRFVLAWICRFPLPLGVWEGLRFVIVALPGLFSYLFFFAIYLNRYVFVMKRGNYYPLRRFFSSFSSGSFYRR